MNLNKHIFQYPVFKLLLPFIIGIIIEIYTKFYSNILLFSAITFILFLTFIVAQKTIIHKYAFRWLYGFIVFLNMVLFGIIITSLNKNKPDDNFNIQDSTYIGIIDEIPEKKENSLKTTVKLLSPKNYKVILYLEPSDNEPAIGNYIIFNTRLQEIKNPGNPHEFDYKKYLSFHNIFLQSYVKKENWKISKVKSPFNIRYYANNISNAILNIYESNELSGKELNIISAITLGYKSNLSRETKEIFSKSGAIHILAVSGLHVGIIFLILSFALKFLNKNNGSRIIKSIIILLSIWIYAFIAGLSPSIQRASLMFSIITLGNLLNRQNSIYQSLALSAFILLLINPYNITEIGFQLSYLAVFGIVYFQPKIFKLIIFKNPVLSYLWALMAVSIAAQITTFPLTLFYFHQFPSLFLLTNLLVVPYAFIIIIFTILGILFSFLPSLSLLIFSIIEFQTNYLYLFLEFIQNQQFALIENIFFVEYHLILYFLLIIFITSFIIQKSGKFAILSLTVILSIIILNQFSNYTFTNNKKYVAYNTNGNSLHAFYINKKCYLLSDSNLNESGLIYAVKNDLLFSGIKNNNIYFITKNEIPAKNKDIYYKKIFDHYYIFKFDSIKILFVDKALPDYLITNKKLFLDYIIIKNNANVDVSDLVKTFNTGKIIIDSSNNYYNAKKWINQCNNLEIPYHYINMDGAFEYIL